VTKGFAEPDETPAVLGSGWRSSGVLIRQVDAAQCDYRPGGAIVSPIAGTTRDAVDEAGGEGRNEFVFVDTAGIRRKGKDEADGGETQRGHGAPPHPHDGRGAAGAGRDRRGAGAHATHAGYAHEGGRAVIVVVNKWDSPDHKKKNDFEQDVKDHFKFLDLRPGTFHLGEDRRRCGAAVSKLSRKLLNPLQSA